jgi:ATP-dependent DNA helicase RecG
MNADGIYTNLGLLLSDQCLHTVKLAVFEGTAKAVFKDRREFSGSLINQLNDIYDFIDRYNRIRSEINGLRRLDKRDYPPEAVREALLNALVHKDYSFSDSTLISIFDDRIEFVSIGGLVRGITFDDMMLGISIARNKNLANVFYRLTLIEAYGTGMPKIMRSYEGFAAKPNIEVTDNAFKITLPNTNEIPEKAFLNENESSVLNLFKEKDFIVRKDIESALEVSQTMAVRILKSLADKGEIRAIGGGKNTRYLSNK